MSIYNNIGSSFESTINRHLSPRIPGHWRVISPEVEDKFREFTDGTSRLNQDYALLFKRTGKLYFNGMIFQLEGEY